MPITQHGDIDVMDVVDNEGGENGQGLHIAGPQTQEHGWVVAGIGLTATLG